MLWEEPRIWERRPVVSMCWEFQEVLAELLPLGQEDEERQAERLGRPELASTLQPRDMGQMSATAQTLSLPACEMGQSHWYH